MPISARDFNALLGPVSQAVRPFCYEEAPADVKVLSAALIEGIRANNADAIALARRIAMRGIVNYVTPEEIGAFLNTAIADGLASGTDFATLRDTLLGGIETPQQS